MSRFLRGVVSAEQFAEWMQDDYFREWVIGNTADIPSDELTAIKAAHQG